MRLFIIGVLFFTAFHTQAASSPYDLHLQIYPNGDQFQIMADYKVGLSLCQSVIFIRDYEAAINFPGIKESKIISRSGNKVLVERTVEDHILLISIQMRSIVQYKETSDQVLNFEQISGDAKYYKGSWLLDPETDGTRFKFQATIELSSIVLRPLAEYFITSQMTKRFEAMAENATQRLAQKQFSCK